MPFQHELIDLSRKPAEFLELSPTGLVPLLQLDDGSLVTESVPVARCIATTFDAHVQMLPPADAPAIDSFVSMWTGDVEPAYYSVLRAGSEPKARFATACFTEQLAKVEQCLFACRMRDTGCCEDKSAAFLLGEQFSFGEAVAAPWVERMLLMLPYWRGVDTLKLCEAHGLERTSRWMQAVAMRPSVQRSSAGEDEMVRASKLYYVEHASPGTRGEAAL